MSIFRATVDDVPRIMECARLFCEVIPDCPLDEAHYGRTWRDFIESGAGAIWLMDVDGKIGGGIGGLCHPEMLTGRMLAVELFWYVKAEHRGSQAIRLLCEFEKWAAEKNCSHIAMIHMECSMPGTMKQIYSRMGYELFETIYRRAIKCL